MVLAAATYQRQGKIKAAQHVIANEPGKARWQAEAAHGCSALRQQHDALLRFGQLDHPQLNSMHLNTLPRPPARAILIGSGKFDRLSCGLLHRLKQHPNLGALLLVGQRDLRYF
jgi:hypothetical protein